MESANPVLKGMFAAVAKIQLTPIGMVKNVFAQKILVCLAKSVMNLDVVLLIVLKMLLEL